MRAIRRKCLKSTDRMASSITQHEKQPATECLMTYSDTFDKESWRTKETNSQSSSQEMDFISGNEDQDRNKYKYSADVDKNSTNFHKFPSLAASCPTNGLQERDIRQSLQNSSNNECSIHGHGVVDINQSRQEVFMLTSSNSVGLSEEIASPSPQPSQEPTGTLITDGNGRPLGHRQPPGQISTIAGPYCCSICLRTSSSFGNLCEHARIHLPPPACKICSSQFSSQKDLRGHMSCHITHKDLFTCTACSWSFKSKEGMNNHLMKFHTNIPKHLCPHCFAQFPKVHELMNHMQSHLHANAVHSSD